MSTERMPGGRGTGRFATNDTERARGIEMEDLTEAYRVGVMPLLEKLRDCLPSVGRGDPAAIEFVRAISHQLKGS